MELVPLDVVHSDVITNDEVYSNIILPPEGIRNVIDKTAAFVASKGPDFERRMLLEPNARDRFEFLYPSSPYRGYYDVKLAEYISGEVKSVKPLIPEAIVQMRKKETEKKDKVLMIKTQAENNYNWMSHNPDEELSPPENDIYSFPSQPYLAPIDFEIVKLSALFVAVNGPTFLAGLKQRERNNTQFEFLKPTSQHSSYFTHLVETYKKTLQPLVVKSFLSNLNLTRTESPPVVDEDWGLPVTGGSYERSSSHYDPLQPINKPASFQRILQRMYRRYKWNYQEDKQKKRLEEEQAEERAAMASINWDDLVIVETIIFTEADLQMKLPTPLDPNMLTKSQPLSPPVPMATPITTLPAPTLPTPSPPPPTPLPVVEPLQVTTTTVQGEKQRLVLKPDYVRRRKGHAVAKLRCPLTGQFVPVDQMTQHLKILLLDPKWKQQRDQLLIRAQKESAFQPDSDVETNIAAFVIKRPDLFGTVEDEVSPLFFSPPIRRPHRSWNTPVNKQQERIPMLDQKQ